MAGHLLNVALLLAPGALAYPFVAGVPNVDSSVLKLRTVEARDDASCPFNPNHVPAAPVTKKYPYNHAKNGLPGLGIGGYLVPAPGDTLHEYRAPNPKTDIRGPCPGLNTAANHGFLARDGITSMEELVDMQQNVYNVGYDLALVLAIAGVATDGDFLGSGKISIGCDATSRTSSTGRNEPGLDKHNTFEADVSLTRQDYDIAVPAGNDYMYNNSLFTEMMTTCAGNCNVSTLGLFRYNRWQESKMTNPKFSFSVGQVLLYGAASFLYELFPAAGGTGTGDELTEMSFFGANKDANGKYYFNGGERLPPNWKVRVVPFSSVLAVPQILEMYLPYPVPFGHNDGVNNFKPIDFTPYVEGGHLTDKAKTPQGMSCMLWHMLTVGFPTSNGGTASLPKAAKNSIVSKVGPLIKDLISAC